MALLFMDGFDHYDDADILQKWTNKGGAGFTYWYIEAGGRTDRCLRLSASSAVWVYKNISPGSATITAGFAFRAETVDESQNFFTFRYSGTSEMGLRVAGGYMRLYRGGTLVDTGSATIIAETWNHIVFEVYSHDSSGTAKVWINGELDINFSGDTRVSGTPDNIYLYASVNNDTSYDDMYILDNTGSINNSSLGDCKIETLYPDGAGNYSQWSPTGGASNYLCVDDAQPDDDSTYVATSGTDFKDSYTMDDLATAQGTIYAVQSCVFVKKDDAATVTIDPMFRISSTDYQVSGVGLTTDYTYGFNLLQRSPATDGLWTVSEVNSLEFGYNKN